MQYGCRLCILRGVAIPIFTMRGMSARKLIPALPAREIMLAPRLNEGCPLARVTLRADTSRGSRNGDVVHSAGPALWGLTNQQVSSATARLRELRLLFRSERS